MIDESTCPPIIRQVFITIDLIEHLGVVIVERGLPGAAIYTKLFLKRQAENTNYAIVMQRLAQTKEYQVYMHAIDMGFLFICDYVVGKEIIVKRNRMTDRLYIKEDFVLDSYAAYNFEVKHCLDIMPFHIKMIDNSDMSIHHICKLLCMDIYRLMNM